MVLAATTRRALRRPTTRCTAAPAWPAPTRASALRRLRRRVRRTSTANGLILRLTSTWGFRGAFTHNWDPYWNTAVYGAYGAVRYDGAAKTLICGSAGMVALLTAGSTCNPDFNIVQAGLITRWTPVKNLTFSGDVAWSHLDQKYSGAAATVVRTGSPSRPASTS